MANASRLEGASPDLVLLGGEVVDDMLEDEGSEQPETESAACEPPEISYEVAPSSRASIQGAEDDWELLSEADSWDIVSEDELSEL